LSQVAAEAMANQRARGLLLNVKWTVAVCWHHSTCGGAQDYSAWPCSRGATGT